MQTGLARRFSRLMKGSPGSSLLVALDHGLTSGPPPGFEHYSRVQSWIEHPEVDAIVMHKGALTSFTRRGMALTKPIILQSNGMSDRAANPADKPILIAIEDALRLGADAISLEFAAEPASFGENLRALSAHIDSADRLGVPVLVMLGIANPPRESEAWVRTHLAIARTLVELGASIIKIPQPPDASDWRPVIDGIREDVHVVMAGGAAVQPEVALERARVGMDAGAGGVCMGRNIFQHPQPGQFLTELGAVVHGVARRRSVPAGLVVAGS